MLTIETIPADKVPEALLWSNRSGRNRDWDLLAEKLQDAKVGDWVRVLPGQLPGKTLESKRANVAQAMRNRNLRITTANLGAHLWLRLRTSDEPMRKPRGNSAKEKA